jgi:hypothetical protein
MKSAVDVDAMLRGILKRYDRIGFGRRGVLDAEEEMRRFGAGLAPADEDRFRRIIQTWLDTGEATRTAAVLHYNLTEHVQALAIRLCASIPILESLPLLRRLLAEGIFDGDDSNLRRDALQVAVRRLGDVSDRCLRSPSRER